MAGKRKDVYLVCGGKYHDFDFARLELLKLLAEHDVVRVKVANDYSDVEAMCESDLLVTYTCDEVPDMAGQARLKSYIENGGKWFALHATNSVLEWLSHDPPLLRAPRENKDFMEVLGSQFWRIRPSSHTGSKSPSRIILWSRALSLSIPLTSYICRSITAKTKCCCTPSGRESLTPFKIVTGRAATTSTPYSICAPMGRAPCFT